MINLNTLYNIPHKIQILPQSSLSLYNLIENYNFQLDYIKIKKIEEESEFYKLNFNLKID
jgi:hypothetical protein